MTEKSVLLGDLQRTVRKELSDEADLFKGQEQQKSHILDGDRMERVFLPELSLALLGVRCQWLVVRRSITKGPPSGATELHSGQDLG